MMLVEDLERVLESMVPTVLAEPWDNTGLLVGRRSNKVEAVLVALDLTGEVLVEAATGDYQVIVTHHPLIFEPLKRITDEDRLGILVTQLIAADIALFALHTNLDGAPGGLCELVAEELGLADTCPLTRPAAGWKKLVGFVPAEALEKVSQAVFAAGGGRIGEYEGCAWRTEGEGTFIPSERAHPHIGTPGQGEVVRETRWETVVPTGRLPTVVRAFLQAHPYEEPAFDIYPLQNVLTQGGRGRVGATRARTSLVSLAEATAQTFGLDCVGYSGDPDRLLDRVAVVTGSGRSLIEEAARVADALVTGDLGFHDAEKAGDLGLALVLVPHGDMEAWAMERWTERLRARLDQYQVRVDFSTEWRSPWSQAHAVTGTGRNDIARLFDLEQAVGVSKAELPSRLVSEGEEEPEIHLLRVDGGSRGNPGPAAIGIILEDDQGTTLEEIGARIGTATNNVAEYQALITGLETALDRGVSRLRILSDSELLVRQLRGDYKVRSPDLRHLFHQVRALVQQFDRVEIKHVTREENTAADGLVNRALNGLL